jgi:hypothetical protein
MTPTAHRKLTAGLHVALALFGLAVSGSLGVFLGSLFSKPELQKVSGMVSAMGALVLVPFALLSLVEMVGAILLWTGRKAGVAITQVCSFLQLINLPIGTAIGVYSLWVLSRPEVESGQAPPEQ